MLLLLEEAQPRGWGGCRLAGCWCGLQDWIWALVRVCWRGNGRVGGCLARLLLRWWTAAWIWRRGAAVLCLRTDLQGGEMWLGGLCWWPVGVYVRQQKLEISPARG